MVDVYSDAATFGKISANVRLIIAVVISIIFIIIGIYIVVQPVKRNKMVRGIITSSNCIENITMDKSVQKKYYECILNVKCTINDKEITSIITKTNTFPYTINQTINLYYDPNDILNIDTFSDNYHIWGWILICIAIFIVLGAGIWSYIVHQSKFAAAVGGGSEAVGIFGNVFKGLLGGK